MTILSRCAAAQDETLDDPHRTFALDWVPLEAVPESLRDRECLNLRRDAISTRWHRRIPARRRRKAISTRTPTARGMQDNEVILTGEANAVQGYRHMRSDKVVINREQESATLSGNVTLREPNVLLQGDSAQIYSKTGEAVIYDTQFVLHQEHMRGTADILERDARRPDPHSQRQLHVLPAGRR